MKLHLYPDEYVSSTYRINFEKLYEEGYRGIIFDIDNTLVPHGAPADERSLELFRRLRNIGFESCLLSNNKEPRVAMFNESIATKYLCEAHKPSRQGYEQAMQQMGTDVDTTLFIGDQIFTDLLGAKNAGLRMILVKPMNPKEEIQIVLKRIPEKLILATYHIYRLFCPEKDQIEIE
jgi:hypothetical protein